MSEPQRKQAGWQVAIGHDVALLSFDVDRGLQVEYRLERLAVRMPRAELTDLRDAISSTIGLVDRQAKPDASEAPLLDVNTVRLAEHFFRDHPLGTDENVQRLARAIQSTVEDTILEIEKDDDK